MMREAAAAGRSGRRRAQEGSVLELVDVSRRFRDVVALDGVSFSAPQGQMVGFVGPNGAGKTTAMRIVLGVLEADRGEVRWRGRPVDAEARRRFGYMPEERGLYPKMRVLDQLVYLGRLHGLDATEAPAAADAWRSSGSRTGCAIPFSSSRSGTSSVSSSPRRSSTRRSFSSSTSRSPGSIRSAWTC
jgi:ABC-type glutathione transport system ATPase component